METLILNEKIGKYILKIIDYGHCIYEIKLLDTANHKNNYFETHFNYNECLVRFEELENETNKRAIADNLMLNNA